MPESLTSVLTNASSGLSAQSTRMNTIASNLANVGNVGSSEEETYHAKYPVFSEVTQKVPGLSDDEQPVGGVRVTSIKNSDKEIGKRYEPSNPMANQDGYIYTTNVNPIEQMTDMISASKEYEANVDVMNTTKNMMAQSIGVLKE